MYLRNYDRHTIDDLCIRGFYTKAELAKKMNVKMETLQLYMNRSGVYPDTIKKIESVVAKELVLVATLYSHIPINFCTERGLKIEFDKLTVELNVSKKQLGLILNVPDRYIYNCCDEKNLSPRTIKKLALSLCDYYKSIEVIVS